MKKIIIASDKFAYPCPGSGIIRYIVNTIFKAMNIALNEI